MSELLHNMSAPPRSEVRVKKKQVAKYLMFDPRTLNKLLGNKVHLSSGVDKRVKHYVEKHPNIIKSIKKPTGFMIGEYIEIKDKPESQTKYKRWLERYEVEECVDAELLILVLCSTMGDLYIPDRTLSYEKTKFNKILLFSKEEVNS